MDTIKASVMAKEKLFWKVFPAKLWIKRSPNFADNSAYGMPKKKFYNIIHSEPKIGRKSPM